jgi:hypothetical protein
LIKETEYLAKGGEDLDRAWAGINAARAALKAEPETAVEALAARPLIERLAQLRNQGFLGVRALANQAAMWLRENPPGQPVAIEPRGCPTPGACSCVEITPPSIPANYIDPEHTGRDRELLQAFYRACAAEGGTADEIHLRGIKAVLGLRCAPPAPEPGEVGELVEWLNQVAQYLVDNGVTGAPHVRGAAILLERQEAELAALRGAPVAWCRSDEFENAMNRGGSFSGWKDPGAGANKCDMQLYAIPIHPRP